MFKTQTVMPQADQFSRPPLPRPIGIPSPEPSHSRALRADIDKLKDPSPYRKQFESETVQQLSQAIDLLHRLQVEALGDASRLGYEKLRDARFHLDQALKDHFTA